MMITRDAMIFGKKLKSIGPNHKKQMIAVVINGVNSCRKVNLLMIFILSPERNNDEGAQKF